MKSKSMRIVDGIVDRCKEITVANGYNNDVGSRVYRGRRQFDNEDTFPVITISSAGDKLGDSAVGIYGREKLEKSVEIHGITDVTDKDNPSDDAELLIADIKKAVFAGNERLGGDAITIKYNGSSVDEIDESFSKIGCIVLLRVIFAEDLTNPNS